MERSEKRWKSVNLIIKKLCRTSAGAETVLIMIVKFVLIILIMLMQVNPWHMDGRKERESDREREEEIKRLQRRREDDAARLGSLLNKKK